MVSGFADTRPIAGNGSEDGRRRNRRAEIIIRPDDVQVTASARRD
jgi:flagellar motor protein MotB